MLRQDFGLNREWMVQMRTDWLDGPFPTLLAALEEASKPAANAHWDRKAPEEAPSVVIYYPPDVRIDKAAAPIVQQEVGVDYCGTTSAR